MTDPHPQPEYTITKEELLIVEHGCIYPDTDECVGKRCKYHNPNPVFRENIVCLLNEHDVADKVRSRTHTPAAPATDFDCDNTICLDYKSKCGGCIPERCNYQKSLKKQKEQDHDYTIKEGVLDEMESFLDTIEQTATDPGYLDATNTMREYITESLRGGAP